MDENTYQALLDELETHWKVWDQLVDRGAAPDAAERLQVRDRMVDVLNRRNYIRNLVRDVNAALEE